LSDIVFEGVGRVFDQRGSPVVALESIDFTIRNREFVAVVGPSGCGKTTLLRMAAGLDFPTTGSVRVGGEIVRGPGPDRTLVFQQFALFPWKTVRQNIEFGLICAHKSREEREAAVRRYIDLMGLEGREEAYPHQLSGGMQQRVAIARSYALDPDVLLMDEPFGALDAQTRVVMQEELIKLARVSPRTVMFITHSVEEAVYLADRVAVMSKRPGRIREVIDVAEIRSREHWSERHVEETMDLASFVHLRTAIWKLLREDGLAAAANL
jgi:NitT/TauT family transport system ATP-binding protein